MTDQGIDTQEIDRKAKLLMSNPNLTDEEKIRHIGTLFGVNEVVAKTLFRLYSGKDMVLKNGTIID